MRLELKTKTLEDMNLVKSVKLVAVPLMGRLKIAITPSVGIYSTQKTSVALIIAMKNEYKEHQEQWIIDFKSRSNYSQHNDPKKLKYQSS